MSRIVKTLLARKWGPISMLQGGKMGANFRQKHQHAIFSTLAPMSENLMGKRGLECPAPNCLASSSVQIRAVGAPKIPNPPIGFQILDFRFQILGFGFRILGFWICHFGLLILDVGFWISDFGLVYSPIYNLDLAATNGPVWILDLGFATFGKLWI